MIHKRSLFDKGIFILVLTYTQKYRFTNLTTPPSRGALSQDY